MLLLIVLVTLAASVVLAGLKLRSRLKGVNVSTVSGAVLTAVCFVRYLTYGVALAFVIAFTMKLISGEPQGLLTHVFTVDFDSSNYSISDVNGDNTGAQILEMRGNVQVFGTNSTLIALELFAFISILSLSHLALTYGESVLEALYKRQPFTQTTAQDTRRLSVSILALWGAWCIYQTLMSLYLESTLVVEGVQLGLINIADLTGLFVAGIVYVLSEAFQIGYELKQDQELTV